MEAHLSRWGQFAFFWPSSRIRFSAAAVQLIELPAKTWQVHQRMRIASLACL